MRAMTKTKASPRPYSSRNRGWPLFTRLALHVIFLATFAHGVIDDACRGTCDKYPDRYCEGWFASCELCSRSTKTTKCIEYFEKLISPTTLELPTPVQDLSQPSSPTTTTQTAIALLDSLPKEVNPNPIDFQNQTEPPTPNLTKPNQSHSDTKLKNGGKVPKDPANTDGTVLAESDSFGTSVLIGPLMGVVVVITLGVVFVCWQQRRTRPPVLGEEPRDAKEEEEIQDLVKLSIQERGEVGGPSLLPNGQHVFLKNEIKDLKETQL